MKKIALAALLGMAALQTTQAKTLSKSTLLIVKVDEFKKIDPAELPPAVVQALIKEYPTSRLSQAFKNKQGKYKLIMILKSGTKRTIYIDAYGRWITKK